MQRFLIELESDSDCESEDEEEGLEPDDAGDDVCLFRLLCLMENKSSLCKRLAISELFVSKDFFILDKTVRIWDDTSGS